MNSCFDQMMFLSPIVLCSRRASSMWQEYLNNAQSRNLVFNMEAQIKEHEVKRKIVKLLKK